MLKKSIYLFLIIISSLFIIMLSGVVLPSEQNQFNDSSTSKTFGKSGEWSSTVYINLLKDSVISNATLKLIGKTGFTYQENADSYSSTGTWNNLEYTYDGDWDTYGSTSSGDVYLYINYTKPSNALSSSLWQVKDQDATINLTIPNECWSQSPLQFRGWIDAFVGPSTRVYWHCYDGTSWQELRVSGVEDGYYAYLYEEAMLWAEYPSNVTFDIGNDGDVEFNSSDLNFVESYNIYTNGTGSSPDTFYVLDDNLILGDGIWELNSSFNNKTGINDITNSGIGVGRRIVGNNSDFWIYDYDNEFIYHLDSSYNNQTDGHSLPSWLGDIFGFDYNNSDYFILDNIGGYSKIVFFNNSFDNYKNISVYSDCGSTGCIDIEEYNVNFYAIFKHVTLTDSIYKFDSSGDKINNWAIPTEVPIDSIGNAGLTMSNDKNFWISGGVVAGGSPYEVMIYHLKREDFDYEKSLSDFSSEISDYLSTCTADSQGYCDVPLNISGTNGKVQISNINITYTESENITTCRNLTIAGGNYTLKNNVSSGGTCFEIKNNTISLNGGNYTIFYAQTTEGDGIKSDGYNEITIQDLKIELNKTSLGSGPSYSRGIHIEGGSHHTLKKLNLTIQGERSGTGRCYGIYLIGVNDSLIQNVQINTTGYKGHGIYLSALSYSGHLMKNNTIENSSIYSLIASTHNIYLDDGNGKINNTLIRNNNLYPLGGSFSGISGNLDTYRSEGSCSFINITNVNIKGSPVDGISIQIHNEWPSPPCKGYITDSNISGASDDDIDIDEGLWSLLNVSYISEEFTLDALSDGGLTRKWYYRAYVNDSTNGNALEGINVTAYNVSDDYQFNLTTDATGYTQKTEVIDYLANGTAKNYYSLYTIYAGNETYPYSSHTYNVTLIKNNLKDVFSLKIDDIAPNVTIISPLNKTYTTSSIDFNLTVVDNRAVDTCLYTLNSGIKNYTMSNPSGSNYNATNSSIADGGYLANFYCNDTYNNLNNSESVSFSVDTTPPTINITSPSNTTYDHNANIALKYTVSDSGVGVQSCWYSTNNGITNISISCGTNVTLDAIQGSNTWLIGSNDSVGNQNYSSVTFNVDALTESVGTWTYYYPKLNYQTKWFNSLTITSKLNYDYNASLNISTDTLAVNESIIVRHQDGTNLSYNFTRNDNGMVNWTGLIYGYVTGTSNTTYFTIWYNTTKINLTYVNYTITEVGHQYQIYNITITANSTREIKDAYVYFNFSDTNVISNTLYNCTSSGVCAVDMSNYEDVTWSDVDGDGAYDLVEWFVDSITNNRTYQLKNSAGSPVEITQDIDILNPPVKPFDNIEWENTITMYNPNSFSAIKVFKLELPFGAFDITLDDISKNLQYDPYGILQPYILIIDKNDPSHTESVYLAPGETKTFKIKYKTSSVTVYSSTYFPTYFEVDKKALIVNVLRVKNQADDVVSDIEYRIPIDYAEDLTVCEGEYKDGCPEEDDANYENVTLDTAEEVDGEYKLEISNISANAAKMITLSYYIPTVKLVSIEIGRRSILGNLTTFKKYEFQSIAPFKLSDVRYREPEISCGEVVAIKECDWSGICEKNLIFECPLRLKLGSIDPGDSKNVYLWYIPEEEVRAPPKGAGWIAKFWNWGKQFTLKKGSILWYVFGWLGTETETGDKVIYSGRIIIFLVGMLIIIGGIIFIILRKRKKVKF